MPFFIAWGYCYACFQQQWQPRTPNVAFKDLFTSRFCSGKLGTNAGLFEKLFVSSFLSLPTLRSSFSLRLHQWGGSGVIAVKLAPHKGQPCARLCCDCKSYTLCGISQQQCMIGGRHIKQSLWIDTQEKGHNKKRKDRALFEAVRKHSCVTRTGHITSTLGIKAEVSQWIGKTCYRTCWQQAVNLTVRHWAW